jgi:hypothetical protein
MDSLTCARVWVTRRDEGPLAHHGRKPSPVNARLVTGVKIPCCGGAVAEPGRLRAALAGAEGAFPDARKAVRQAEAVLAARCSGRPATPPGATNEASAANPGRLAAQHAVGSRSVTPPRAIARRPSGPTNLLRGLLGVERRHDAALALRADAVSLSPLVELGSACNDLQCVSQEGLLLLGALCVWAGSAVCMGPVSGRVASAIQRHPDTSPPSPAPQHLPGVSAWAGSSWLAPRSASFSSAAAARSAKRQYWRLGFSRARESGQRSGRERATTAAAWRSRHMGRVCERERENSRLGSDHGSCSLHGNSAHASEWPPSSKPHVCVQKAGSIAACRGSFPGLNHCGA